MTATTQVGPGSTLDPDRPDGVASSSFSEAGGGEMFEQSPVHEDVAVADLLHEVQVSSVIEKTAEMPRHLPACGEHEPHDVVFQDIDAAEPEEERCKHCSEVAENGLEFRGVVEATESGEEPNDRDKPHGVQSHEDGHLQREPDSLIGLGLAFED
jgi:hypothetical protein